MAITDSLPPLHQHAIRVRARAPIAAQLTEALAFIVMLIMMNATSVAKYTTMAWLGAMLLIFIIRRGVLLEVVLKWWPVLLVPIIAVATMSWSDAPSISGRYGVQLLLTALAGVVLARSMPPARFVTILFLAMFGFCLLSVASGRQGPSVDGPVLIGLVGSKNQMSGMAYFLVVSAVTVLGCGQAPRFARLLSLPGILLGIYIVATTASATAVILTMGCSAAILSLSVLQRLSPAGRVGVVLAACVVLSPVALLKPEIDRGIEHVLVNVLRKDPGLTGRDVLWARADELIARKPILGYGYQALWLGDSADAIGLLRLANRTDGRTFNFHNNYRQFAVDAGLVGLAVLIITVVIGVLTVVRQYVLHPSTATTGLMVFLIATSGQMYTEVLLVAFSLHTILFFACLTYAFWSPNRPWGQTSPPEPPPSDAAAYPVGVAPHYAFEHLPQIGGPGFRPRG